MGSLIKYEFRKLLNIKFIILVLTGVFEVMFLVGFAAKNESILCTAIALLFFCTIISISVLAILAIRVLSKELNTKQGYMLFMTPNSSYKILGAKIIESAISIFAFGAFFILLGLFDINLLSDNKLFNAIIDGDAIIFLTDSSGLVLNAVAILFNVITIVIIAFLAVIVSAALLNGKKYNGLLSFGLFLIINFIVSDSMTRLSVLLNLTEDKSAISIFICVACTVLSVLIYYISALIMDKKLSV